MKKILLLLSFCWIFSAQYSQAQQVRNVRIEADDEKVTIIYDLIPSGAVRNYTVCLRTSDPAIKPLSTTGAVGKNRTTGINQKVEWFYSSDGYTAEQINNLKVEVYAFDPNNPKGGSGLPPRKVKKIPIYAGLGTVSLSGLGLMIGGFTKRGDALDNYELYKTNGTSSSFYAEQGITRDEFYDETQKTNRNAQLMMFGGGAVFLTAGYILVNRVLWIKRIENQNSSRALPVDLQCNTYRQRLELNTFSTASAGTGIGFTLHF